MFLIRGILFTLTILIWGIAGIRGSSIFLSYLSANQTKWAIVQPRTLPILAVCIKMLLILTTIYFLMLAWNINITAWLASAGIMGLAIAYAAQDTLASLLSGIIIITDGPYKLGDVLVLDSGLTGEVTNIGFRSTRIRTFDDVEVIIPNSIMANSTVTNMSGGPHVYARINIPIGVAYGCDVDAVQEIILDIAQSIDHIVLNKTEFKPRVHFVNMGASSLDFMLRVWVRNPADQALVIHDANTKIYTRLTAANIEIPYNKQDIYLYPMTPPDDA